MLLIEVVRVWTRLLLEPEASLSHLTATDEGARNFSDLEAVLCKSFAFVAAVRYFWLDAEHLVGFSGSWKGAKL